MIHRTFSTISISAGKTAVCSIDWGSLHLAILWKNLNDENNGYDVTVIKFANSCFCLLNTLIFFLWKGQAFFQRIVHAVFQDASWTYTASCCPQPEFSYRANTVASLLHQYQSRKSFSCFLHLGVLHTVSSLELGSSSKHLRCLIYPSL